MVRAGVTLRRVPDSTSSTDELNAVADHLYGLRPDEFVAARDHAVSTARERGDRELALAIARLRRPTRAAWLANLLAQQRPGELDGLLALAGDLAAAQRTLDGGALRTLSSQRHRLVAAMAREAGRLAEQAGESPTEHVLRELQAILEAALADTAVAAEVRSGRLTRTVTYSGFGPSADSGAAPIPAPRDPPERTTTAAQDRERADREQERAERERELAAAEQEEATARTRQEVDEAARADAEAAHTTARERVVELTAALAAAREDERSTAAAARTAATAAKESARAASAAATRTARARARRAECTPG